MTTAVDAQLDVAFKALADPTRRAIVRRLAQGDATLTQLAVPFAMSLPAVAKHVTVLERSGLVTRPKQGQSRPCRLERAPLDEALGWIDEARRVWAERLDRLEDHLRDISPTTTPPSGDPDALTPRRKAR